MLGDVLSASDYTKETWEPRVEQVEKRLASWRGRSLSYQGRALVIKMLSPCRRFGICVPFSLCQAGLPPELTKLAIWRFFWEGKRDLLARRTVYGPNPLAVLESWTSGPRLTRCAFNGSNITSRIPRANGSNFFLSCCAGLLAPTPRRVGAASFRKSRISRLPLFHRDHHALSVFCRVFMAKRPRNAKKKNLL